MSEQFRGQIKSEGDFHEQLFQVEKKYGWV
jgi:hypothetical protein